MTKIDNVNIKELTTKYLGDLNNVKILSKHSQNTPTAHFVYPDFTITLPEWTFK